MRSRFWRLLTGTALAVLLLAAFISLHKSEMPVRAERATRQTIMNTIATNGKVEPLENFEAHAPMATTVKRLLVREGDRVKAGQWLLELDDAAARAQAAKAIVQLRAAEAGLSAVRSGGTHEEVLTTEAQLVKARTERDAAERNLNALRRLQQTGAASAGEVQEAQNRLKRAQAETQLLEQKRAARYSRPEVEKVQAEAAAARAAYQAAQELLRSSNLRAPRAGTVYSMPVRPGAFVHPGDLLVEVAELSTMQVRAFVDEPEIGKLSPGQKVSITWDAIPGRVWPGVVTRVPTTVVSRSTRTVGEVLCEVDNQDLKLLPNVNVNTMIITAIRESVITVPREAVHEDEGRSYVYAIQDGKLRRTEVKTGISSLTRIEVREGLSDKAQVAIGSLTTRPLKDGQPVRILQP